MSDVVEVSRQGPVTIFTLNRPEARNAVNRALTTQLGAALAEFAADPEQRVGVLTGTGQAFCAGADLKALASGEGIDDPDHPERGFAGMVQFFIDKPLIAAVNGFALGGGTELVLVCDLAVMAQSATLGLPEVKRGLIAGAGGLLRLHRQIPPKIAAELVMTGRPMTSAEGLQWGLVNRVVPDDEVLASAVELAEAVAANAPLAVRASKRLMKDSAAASDWAEELWQRNAEELIGLAGSADFIEGTTAFAQKRNPIWTGR
ncbi:crotonase/enoyl-CoA hydratase family protein [Gordonia crocea]|uniref:Probable enoyl-CoA hydratase EchA17 n=1 Tax=Gordonia crocea TaxID=589162 RepID=A0A7I9V158_9ACTN|nr:crotonase/enoyl-CoA hydratase family protein [Gordonia crocea]GED98912.1 enoyl-CoA hydratase [Gordonia crocea]